MSLIQTTTLTVPLYQLHFLNPQRYPFVLETIARPENGQHFDILFAFPGQSLVLEDLTALYWRQGDATIHCVSKDFLAEFANAWRQQQRMPAQSQAELPFVSGWFMYLSYELVGQIEPRLNLPSATEKLPVACATRIDNAIIYDHNAKQLYLVAEDAGHLQQMLRDLGEAKQRAPVVINETNGPPEIQEELPQRYLHAVDKIKKYIYDGDVFQVNLSRSWSAYYPSEVDRHAVYTALRASNPAPFFGIADIQGVTIYSSSPERLVRVKGSQVETRPIAGTRPRVDRDQPEDSTKLELMQNAKERAEHIMLIDLERNDLGRICIPGSVRVDEMMAVESYAHVHHIVSNVRGELRKDVNPADVIQAMFPGGTITGCPKVRCMEIITELEHTGRGAYTGSMGYIDDCGDMDLNILIRTLVSHQRQISLRAGAGIVADSDPQQELQETRAKARGMLLAVAPNKL